MTDNGTVLVVDDESQLVELFEAFLSELYTVRTAVGGEEALEKLDSDVDVALFDRRMPNINGDELLEEVRDRGYSLPVAMVTGVNPDADILEMEFDDYATKPVQKEDIVSLVKILMQRREYGEQSREFFQLASKKKALSKEDHAEELMEIKERMSELRHDMDETLDELSGESIHE